MSAVSIKAEYLAAYHEHMKGAVGRISSTKATHQSKAQEVNALVTDMYNRLRGKILTARESDKEIQQRLLVLQYCTSVASLEYRHQVWPYEYMALSRRVGELWERFCCAAWDVPSKPSVKRMEAPSFLEVGKKIRDTLAQHKVEAATRKEINAVLDILFELLGTISMDEDEVFTVGGVPHVIDFKSGFGSNEKGNTLRLLAVGRAYKLWNKDTQLFFLVRQEVNNNYLNVIRRSGIWDVRCGLAAYKTIDDLTGSDIAGLRDKIFAFETDLSPEFWRYLSSHLSDLTSYLRW